MDKFSSTRREVFFSNLLLLGLDQAALVKKYGIAVNKDMFTVPNKKGYEIITHFLFSKLSATTRKDYNLPWPLLSIEKSLLQWKPTRRQRKDLEQFFSTEENLWQCLASEVDENTENSVLSPKDIKAEIAILKKLCSESEKVGISCSEENGKIPVTRFLSLLVVCLKPISDIFKTNMCSIPVTSFLNDGFTLKHDLSSIQNMIDKLSEDIIPRLEDSIKELKLAHSFELFEETSESIFKEICSLPSISYNPEAVKARVFLIDPELEEKLQMNISKDIANNSVFSAHLSVSQSLSEADSSVANLASFHGPQLSEIVDFADATFTRKVALINSFRQKLVGESEKRAEALSLKQDEVPVKSHPLKNILEVSDLDDLDFAPSTQFKMRDSWLNAESLLAETLPDISFEE